jgi:hypothetical protein
MYHAAEVYLARFGRLVPDESSAGRFCDGLETCSFMGVVWYWRCVEVGKWSSLGRRRPRLQTSETESGVSISHQNCPTSSRLTEQHPRVAFVLETL